MTELPKTALDLALDKLTTVFDTIDGDRVDLITKMKNVVNQVMIDPNNDPPRVIETKLQIINTFDGLLKSRESSAVTSAKTQMQKKNDETSESSKQMVIELLRNINVAVGHNTGTGVVLPTTGITEAIDKACLETNHPITDDELSVPDVPLKEVE